MAARQTFRCMVTAAVAAAISGLVAGAEQRSVDMGGRYFVYDTALLDWAGAAKFCRERQSHLAFPESESAAAAIAELMAEHGITRIHAGLHDLFAEGDYHTAAGSPISRRCATDWAAGSPTGGNSTNCGSFSAEGLVDAPCSEKNPLICQENLTWSGYELIRGLGYYKYLNDADRTWFEAVQRCHDDGARLLVVNSALEWDALRAKFAFESVWVGVNRLQGDDLFLTLADGYLSDVGFAEWAPGEPAGDSVGKPLVGARAADGLYTRGLADKSFSICERHPFQAA